MRSVFLILLCHPIKRLAFFIPEVVPPFSHDRILSVVDDVSFVTVWVGVCPSVRVTRQ